MVNRNEPEPELELEPQFVISVPAPGGSLISAPQLSAPAPQLRVEVQDLGLAGSCMPSAIVSSLLGAVYIFGIKRLSITSLREGIVQK